MSQEDLLERLTIDTWVWYTPPSTDKNDTDVVSVPAQVKQLPGTTPDVKLLQYRYTREEKEKLISVKATDVQKCCRLAYEANLPGVRNMMDLELNLSSILHNLAVRLKGGKEGRENIMYTNIGNILVSVNPYKALEGLYSKEVQRKYRQELLVEPHVFLVAKGAYDQLRANGRSQSIVISGESGAGKTEAMKKILQYLAEGTNERDGQKTSVEQQILETNPILEAFGNATTVRNNNSSRFGKWTEIYFDARYQICGCKIENYLLEKVRVVHLAPRERNYHIFYHLCAGAQNDPELQKKLKLQSASYYRYLFREETPASVEGIDDLELYHEVVQAFNAFNMKQNEVSTIFSILAGILHLGNVSFLDSGSQGESKIDPSTEDEARMACEMFGWDFDKFSSTIREYQLDKTTKKFRNAQEATLARDSLAKSIYGNLFDWIVQKLNETIGNKNMNPNRCIGVLDIYGFENMPVNSFEQLCINYANEKLQKHFNWYIFEEEKKAGIDEGITLNVEFKDNQPTIDIFEKKGIFFACDECSLKGQEKLFLTKMETVFKSPRASKIPNSQSFSVHHYAGKVDYDSKEFVDKNTDAIHHELVSLAQTGHALLKELFKKVSITANALKQDSVGKRYQQQLQDLINKLESTESQFIRCVKPNSEKRALEVDPKLVMEQLRYAGFLEAIRIRKEGYPTRPTYQDFVHRYRLLKKVSGEDKVIAQNIVQNIPELSQSEKPPQFGITKIFLKHEHPYILDMALRRARMVYTQMLQRQFRKHAAVVYVRPMLPILREVQNFLSANYLYFVKFEELIQKRKSLSVQNHTFSQLEQLYQQFKTLISKVVEAQKNYDLKQIEQSLNEADQMRFKAPEIDTAIRFKENFDQMLKELGDSFDSNDSGLVASASHRGKELGITRITPNGSGKSDYDLTTILEGLEKTKYEMNLVQKAKKTLERLEKQENLTDRITKQLSSRDIQVLNQLLVEGTDLNMDAFDIIKKLNNRIQALKQELVIKENLRLATKNKDLSELQKWITTATDGNLDILELNEAKELRDLIVNQNQHLQTTQELFDECEKMGKGKLIDKEKIEKLMEIINRFKELKLSEHPKFKIANSMLKKREDQEDYLGKLRKLKEFCGEGPAEYKKLLEQAHELSLELSDHEDVIQGVRLVQEIENVEKELHSVCEHPSRESLSNCFGKVEKLRMLNNPITKKVKEMNGALENLFRIIPNRDQDEFDHALEQCKNVGLTEKNCIDITKAKKQFNDALTQTGTLTLLQNAALSENIQEIEQALSKAKTDGVENSMEAQVCRQVLDSLTVQQAKINVKDVLTNVQVVMEKIVNFEKVDLSNQNNNNNNNNSTEQKTDLHKKILSRQSLNLGKLQKILEKFLKAQERLEEAIDLNDEQELSNAIQEASSIIDLAKGEKVDTKNIEELVKKAEALKNQAQIEQIEKNFLMYVDANNKNEVLKLMTISPKKGARAVVGNWTRDNRSKLKKLIPAESQKSYHFLVSDMLSFLSCQSANIVNPLLTQPLDERFETFPRWTPSEKFETSFLFVKIKSSQKTFGSSIPTSVTVINPSLQRSSLDEGTQVIGASAQEQVVKEAKDCFQIILRYCGDQEQFSQPQIYASSLIDQALRSHAARDEIYCQLFKQISDNPKKESISKCWELIRLCSYSFPCCSETPSLIPYLLDKINRDHEKENQEVTKFVKNSLELWARFPTLQPRKPNFNGNWNSFNLQKINFCDESFIQVGYSGTDTLATIQQKVYQICTFQESDKNITDLFALYESTTTPSSSLIKSVSEQVKNSSLWINQQNSYANKNIVLRLKIFDSTQLEQFLQLGSSNKSFLYLLYAQVSQQIAQGSILCDYSTIIKLAALKLLIEFGKLDKEGFIFFDRWREYIPVWLHRIEKTPLEWFDEIEKVAKEQSSQLTQYDAQIDYIKQCSTLVGFGAVVFDCQIKNKQVTTSENGLLVIGKSKIWVISLSKTDSQTIIFEQERSSNEIEKSNKNTIENDDWIITYSSEHFSEIIE